MLADRLNNEPPIFRGYTDSELIAAVTVAIGTCLPVGLMFGIAAGNAGVGMSLGMGTALLMVAFGASVFQRLKRGRPHFYFQQRLRIRAADAGFVQSHWIRHYGVMSLGRW